MLIHDRSESSHTLDDALGWLRAEGQPKVPRATAIGMEVMLPADQPGVGTTHANNRYDHFLISADLADEEAVMCRIKTYAGENLDLAKKVSDHLPVVAWFRVDEAFKDREE